MGRLDDVAAQAYLAPTISEMPLPVQFLAAWIGTWLARRQERLIEYLKEENRVLVEKLGGRVRLTDADRRRLARLGKLIGRRALSDVASVATPDTILRWVRPGNAGRKGRNHAVIQEIPKDRPTGARARPRERPRPHFGT
jgi:hypothetical protein